MCQFRYVINRLTVGTKILKHCQQLAMFDYSHIILCVVTETIRNTLLRQQYHWLITYHVHHRVKDNNIFCLLHSIQKRLCVCVYVVHSFAKEEDFQNILMRLIQKYSIRSESFLESDAIPQCHISLSLIRDVCSFRHHPSSSRQAVGLPWPQRTHSWGEDGRGGCLRGLSVNGRRWKAMLAPSVHCQLSTIEFPIALTVECEIVLLIHMPCLRHSHTHWWKWKADTMHCGVFLKVNATHPKYVTFLVY